MVGSKGSKRRKREDLDEDEDEMLLTELLGEETPSPKFWDRRGGKCGFGKGCSCDSPCSNPNKAAREAIARGAQW